MPACSIILPAPVFAQSRNGWSRVFRPEQCNTMREQFRFHKNTELLRRGLFVNGMKRAGAFPGAHGFCQFNMHRLFVHSLRNHPVAIT